MSDLFMLREVAKHRDEAVKLKLGLGGGGVLEVLLGRSQCLAAQSACKCWCCFGAATLGVLLHVS